MNGAPRDMPVIEVSGRPGRWVVHLPAGDRTASSLRGVKSLVAQEACGSAIHYDPTPAGAGGFVPGSGARMLEGARPGRRRSEMGSGAG
jgi:hypothetical protein